LAATRQARLSNRREKKSRIYLSVDAVDDGTVSGMYPDCVPLDLFGRGNASSEAVDWVTGFEEEVPVSVNGWLPGEIDPIQLHVDVGEETNHRAGAGRVRALG
jgi:hypothetical protein